MVRLSLDAEPSRYTLIRCQRVEPQPGGWPSLSNPQTPGNPICRTASDATKILRVCYDDGQWD